MAFLITESITSVAKNVTGRPRPAFFDICGYPRSGLNGTHMYGTLGQVANISKCTGTVGLYEPSYS